MEAAEDTLKNLPDRGRGWFARVLDAGSAGYGNFLALLSDYISPSEAAETAGRFRTAARILALSVVVFLALFIGTNDLLGPWSLHAATLMNDLLRAGVFVLAVVLCRQGGIAIASQVLLPFTALCFLPLRSTLEPDWTVQPTIFAGIVVTLVLVGWLLDVAASDRPAKWLVWRAAACVGAMGLYAILLGVAWWWVTDGAWFPIFSLAACAAGLPWFALRDWLHPAPETPPASDVPFLYAAAWMRWRFFLIGRLLAIVLSVVPFLLFANALDYYSQIEECVHEAQTPEIVRVQLPHIPWSAYYWSDEGHFLAEKDLAGEPGPEGERRLIYLTAPSVARSPEDPDLPEKFRGDAYAVNVPEDVYSSEITERMRALTGMHASPAEFEEMASRFSAWRVDSLGRLLRRVDLPGEHDFMCLSYHPIGHDDGVIIAEHMGLDMLEQTSLERMVNMRRATKWNFFMIGLIGCVFLWRRGGDSVVARWIGIWLIGASVIPLMDVAQDTLSRSANWFWEESIVYHWNTLASTAAPFFYLCYGAVGICALIWLAMLSPTMAWIHICWPTRIYPSYPSILRRLLIFSKVLAGVFVNCFLITLGYMCISYFRPSMRDTPFGFFIIAWSLLYLPAGALLRIWTRSASEVPRLGVWPLLAVLALNLSLLCYVPIMLNPHGTENTPYAQLYTGATFGWIFVGLMFFLMLKRDFLHTRAVAGFATLVVLIAVPLAINWAEERLAPFLGESPFFRDEGAELVTLTLVVFLFPFLHEWLHEFMLAISVPMLRRVEHRLEHSLEKIVDAESDRDRAHMVSDILTDLGIKRYMFLSRHPRGRFVVDIDALSPSGASAIPEIELSEHLREFLGRRRHFIDLASTAFEWPFFFHQFELHRLARATHSRYILPISVGESLRGMLLLPEGQPEAVISTPALSTNLNNLGLAAAISRPRR